MEPNGAQRRNRTTDTGIFKITTFKNQLKIKQLEQQNINLQKVCKETHNLIRT